MASNIKHLMTVADLDPFPDDDGKRYAEVSTLRNDDHISSPLLPGLELKLSEIFRFPKTR